MPDLFEYRGRDGRARFFLVPEDAKATPEVTDYVEQAMESLINVRRIVQQDQLERAQRLNAAKESLPIELTYDAKSKIEIARWGGDSGPDEVLRKDLFDTKLVTVDDERAYARRRVDMIGRWLREREISIPEAKAANQFQADFHKAHLDVAPPPDLRRVPGQGSDDLSERVVAARECVAGAIDALGGHGTPVANAAWYVLGCRWSVSQWARNEAWGRRGHLNKHVAKGLVLSAISILRQHYDKQRS